jgi:hypothetical protein
MSDQNVLLVVPNPTRGSGGQPDPTGDFIPLAAATATLPIAWPLAARAHQPKLPVVGSVAGVGGADGALLF